MKNEKCNFSLHYESMFFKFVHKTPTGYLFSVTHKILEKSITLNFLGIELFTFLIHFLQYLLCFPLCRQDSARNRKKVKLQKFYVLKINSELPKLVSQRGRRSKGRKAG